MTISREAVLEVVKRMKAQAKEHGDASTLRAHLESNAHWLEVVCRYPVTECLPADDTPARTHLEELAAK